MCQWMDGGKEAICFNTDISAFCQPICPSCSTHFWWVYFRLYQKSSHYSSSSPCSVEDGSNVEQCLNWNCMVYKNALFGNSCLCFDMSICLLLWHISYVVCSLV
ncbi:unnamed protein product [Owenia fusiformis]|uniref:Uncharacterized protein n=1 Tax=Owenia fusiformis TaxID=6347 RepID=A0A8J1YCF0_OWEFU|nr:unnamed protein product [Owenia fusiformis]